MSNFYSENELIELGFSKIGKNVQISKKASLYGVNQMEIGDNVRIDDFCILSGKIKIGNYVHISAFVALYGKFGIEIGNFCGCSPRSTVFSASDDFSGEFMVSPMVPDNLSKLNSGKVIFDNYVQIGANTIVMPGVRLKEGAVTGAFSFVTSDLDEWKIYAGIPAKPIKDRKKDIIKLSKTINEVL